jgi:hypothetical protein
MHNLDRVLNQQETFNEAAFEVDEFEDSNSNEYTNEFEFGQPSAMNEAELAAELLTIGSDAELEQFFGKIFRGISTIARSPVGRIIGGALKQAAKTALPTLGAALGSAIPIPGVGTAIGGMAGRALANALEMETQGLSMEDREFEVAQGLVRLASAAARNAGGAAPGANPNAVATQAIKAAVANLGTLSRVAVANGGRAQSGRWVRRGGSIVILGA